MLTWILCAQALVSSLQQHFLLFSQRLHTSEVERRSLRLQVANLKKEKGDQREGEDTHTHLCCCCHCVTDIAPPSPRQTPPLHHQQDKDDVNTCWSMHTGDFYFEIREEMN